MTIQELPDVISVSDLAKVLGVGKNSAYELVNTGKLKSVRVGRQIRISKAALLQFLEGNETA